MKISAFILTSTFILTSASVFSQSVKCGNAAADSDAVNNVYAGANLQGVQNVMLDINHSHPYWCDTAAGAGSSTLATEYYVSTHSSGGADSVNGTANYIPKFNAGGKSVGNSSIITNGIYNGVGRAATDRMVLQTTTNQGMAIYDSASGNRIGYFFNEGAGETELQLQPDISLNGGGSISLTGNFYVTGDIKLQNAGNIIYIKSGTNASIGKNTLAAGIDTVFTTAVQTTSNIQITPTSDGGGAQCIYVDTISNAAWFVVKSSNSASNDTFNWVFFNQP